MDTTAAVKLDTVVSSVRLYDGLTHPYVSHARDCWCVLKFVVAYSKIESWWFQYKPVIHYGKSDILRLLFRYISCRFATLDIKSFVCVSILSDINECDSNPCMNGSTCVHGINGYSCTCAAGNTGDMCETGRFEHVGNAGHHRTIRWEHLKC